MIIDRADEWIQQQLLSHGGYEPGVSRLLTTALRHGDTFFDIGANIGCHTLVAAAAGAHVHAFEPVPHLVARLLEHISLNGLQRQVIVVQAALSERTGHAPLHVARRVDDGSHSLLSGVPAEGVEIISVSTVTLDEYVERSGCGAPAVVKIDVEGGEALVLRGAHRVLEASPPPLWVFETADRLADQIGESATSVVDAFRRRGYLVFRVPGGLESLQPVEGTTVSGELANYVAVHRGSRRLNAVLGLTE